MFASLFVALKWFSTAMLLPGVLLLAAGCDSAPLAPTASGSSTSAGTLELEIDFSGHSPGLVVDVPCSLDSTALQILERARNMGDLKFESTGSGEFVMVTSINGIENKGGSGKNWLFKINGELAKTSCGVAPVKKGDVVLWVFEDDYE